MNPSLATKVILGLIVGKSTGTFFVLFFLNLGMDYKQEDKDRIFTEICDLITSGLSLRKAIKQSKTINRDTFNEWTKGSNHFSDQYARACEDRADVKFESIEQDYLEEPQRDPESGRIDSAWVALQRLKIDAKKWELSKLMPKKYGDKIENTHIIETPIFTGIDLDVPTDNGSE